MPISVTDKQLDRALILARHKLRIRLAVMAGLFLLAALSVLFAANGAFSYFSQTAAYNQAMSVLWKSDVDWAAVHQKDAPKDLEIGSAYVFFRGNDTYDFAAEINNPNIGWAVQSLGYEFIRADKVIASGQTTLLPGDQRLITVLGYKSSDLIDSIDSVRITSLAWRKLNYNITQMWPLAADPQFQARTITSDGERTINISPKVIWQAKNNTGKNLRTVTWQIILRTAGRVEGVTEYEAHDVLYGQLRRYEVSLSTAVSRPDEVTVRPIIDVFDENNIYLPKVEPSADGTAR